MINGRTTGGFKKGMRRTAAEKRANRREGIDTTSRGQTVCTGQMEALDENRLGIKERGGGRKVLKEISAEWSGGGRLGWVRAKGRMGNKGR